MCPNIEIQSQDPNSGEWIQPELLGDFPDKNGTYQTSHGELEIKVKLNQNPRQVTLSGDFLKGRQRLSGGPEYGPTTRTIDVSNKTGVGETRLDSSTRLVVTLKSGGIKG